eukprot:6480921-Amphidinium_carterae.2
MVMAKGSSSTRPAGKSAAKTLCQCVRNVSAGVLPMSSVDRTAAPYECPSSFLSHLYWGGIVSDHWNPSPSLDAQYLTKKGCQQLVSAGSLPTVA